MAVLSNIKSYLKGGEFLVKDSSPDQTFIPEEFDEEQRMIQSTAIEFVNTEVLANMDKIENQADNIASTLLEKMGELGFLGTHMPEIYGGMQLDMNTNTLIGESFGPAGSFYVAYAAHTGIGMLPILYFGTETQKQKYLPGLISGELKAAYCLTEPSSGSDALAAKTRAELDESGKNYILNGQKMWISNAGFADLLVVFAQIDGKEFTGFIVERGSAGLTFGAEEQKLGIKGSSTRQVFFENVKVPTENLLGERGKGHLIAFNALNIGRFKLCVACIGGAKASSTGAIQYANERIQFKQPISNFGAIQYKLAEQAIRIFSAESAMYRVSHLLNQKKVDLLEAGIDYAGAKLQAAEEYAVECALLKVAGSEVLDYVVDESVQVHGGMGYSEEGVAARAYRDSRINRIFEGTNEINRLLSIDMLFRRALKGQIDIVGPAWKVHKELAVPMEPTVPEGPLDMEKQIVTNFKKIVLMVIGAAAKLQMEGKLNLKEEQEILMNASNMMIDTLMAESTLLRVQKLSDILNKEIADEVYEAMLKVFLADAAARIQKNAEDAIVSFAEGTLLTTLMNGLERFRNKQYVNVKTERRKVASALKKANKYCF